MRPMADGSRNSVNDDYAHFFVPDGHAGTGDGRHRGPVDTGYEAPAADPLDSAWDPVEEMTYLLQDAVSAERAASVPRPRDGTAPPITLTGDPIDNLAALTTELPPIRPHPSGHRKVRVRKLRFTWVQTVSFLIAALAAAVVSMVSVFGGMVSYGPLRHVAFLTGSGTSVWWPLLVYGPWTVASLSVLRAALHRRRAVHSWLVVLLFSSVAMALCVAQADRTFTGVAAAVLPAVAALSCFQQLVRQITMTRPARRSLRGRRRAAGGATVTR
ncbi:DUF2637 domain-containing protein [Streptomyces apricus]|uniref:DUF2637 domain-containing protein n=2 Tax=Streptomyces apricus TaxID=1828112 RepID=A0A5B0AR07_9ACTN|nr:DUF2637 domain-containing protein [Streptomyces apricus]